MRTLFWNVETMMTMLDVSPERFKEVVGLELMPAPVLLGDELLWRRTDVIAWARNLKACTPAEAVAGLWAAWQGQNDPQNEFTCGCCKHFVWADGLGAGAGHCHKYPLAQKHSLVNSVHSCGNHVPKTAKDYEHE